MAKFAACFSDRKIVQGLLAQLRNGTLYDEATDVSEGKNDPLYQKLVFLSYELTTQKKRIRKPSVKNLGDSANGKETDKG